MKALGKFLLAGIMLVFSGLILNAQIDIEGKIKRKVQERAEQRVDEGIDKALDEAEEGIEDAVKGEDEETEESEEQENQEEEKPAAGTKTSEAKPAEAAGASSPVFATYSKYDFIPGEKVILFEDFTQDNVGDFPALWNTNATGEVMTTSIYEGKWFKPMGDGVFLIEKSVPFPDNYTIEFDVIPQYKEGAGDCDFILTIYDQPEMVLNTDLYPGNAGYHVEFSAISHRFTNYVVITDNPGEVSGYSETGLLVPDKLNKIKIWVQKQRIRVYREEKKVYDLPRGILAGYKYNHLRISTNNRGGEPLISNIRISAGQPDLRSKLLTEGRLITYGIYFDPAKDIVKPESYATLKEIAAVLKENPEVRVKIIGHTDSDGNDDSNLSLSKRRAASVKSALGRDFGIDASRIETDGMGEAEPVSSNSTSEGKAANRRVEIVKL